MRRLGSLVGALFVGALVLGAGIGGAQAQSDAQRNRARQLYAEAQALFDSGQFAAAEASFRAAYQAVPNPVVLRAIAAAQERQGNIAQAAATLQQYLREAPDAPDRAEVERRLQEFNSRPATVAISSTPAGAEILVDGQATGQVTPVDLTLSPGEHTVELRLEGYQPAVQRFTAQAATRMRLDVPLQQGGGDAEPPSDEPPAEGGGGGSEDPSAGVWATAGIAAAGLISGTVFGFLALSEQSNFDNAPSHDVADRGEAFALAADISFGVAAAAAITAIVLYIVERNSGGSESPTATSGVRFDVSPWADPNGGGMAAQLRF
jgi:tetratricopeptide (TPR) repeat protein